MKSKLLIIICFFLSCSRVSDQSGPSMDDADADVKILFIGNSHTHFNSGLANHVKAFAFDNGIATDAQMIAPGGFTFEDHANNQMSLNLIQSEDWDYIILQENTFVAVNDPDSMIANLLNLKTTLDTGSAKILLFKTWAYQDSPTMLIALNDVYNEARLVTGYDVISVGTIWKDFLETETINLYSGDNVHPSIEGTYLTSAIFFKALFLVNDINSNNYNYLLNNEDAETIKEFVSNLNL